MIRHVARDHATSANQGPLANGDSGHHNALRAHGSTFPNQRPALFPVLGRFQAQVRIDRPWQEVVGEAHLRPDEDAVLELHSLVQQRIVLDLAMSSEMHVGPNVNPGANIGARANDGALANVDLAPDAAVIADRRLRRDLGGWAGINASNHQSYTLQCSRLTFVSGV